MVAKERGVAEYQYQRSGGKNKHYMQGFAPISGTDGWSIAVVVDRDEMMHPALMGSYILSGLFALTTLLVLIFSVSIGKSFAAPIAACSARLQKLSSGDLHSPVPKIDRKDETGVLAESIEDLVLQFQNIIRELGTVLGNIAKGDLRQQDSDVEYPGDFVALQEDLQIISEKLNQTIGGIADAADLVAYGAEQVSSTSDTLSHGALDQTNVVSALSDTIDGISKESKHTMELAHEAKNSADRAGKELTNSVQYIEHLNKAMSTINESSQEIVRVISTIENIAFQTNILALNAAVEAARAGAVGKGFAVVADEVRNLATKSDEAAKATRELIEHSISSVESGNQVVDKVVQSITEVTALATEAVSKMEVVADAVEEQTNSMQQITDGMGQISGVAQTNSNSAEESASASQELSTQADTLKRLMSQFTR